MKWINEVLDNTTMYRLVLYCLAWLATMSILLGWAGVLHYSPLSLLLSLIILLVVSFFSNILFAKLYQVPTSQESSVITGLLLYFILLPAANTEGYTALVVAALVAVASKYAIRWRGAHIFNPAAFGAAVVSLASLGTAGWWVAGQALFVPTLIISFLILKKLRRFQLFSVFILPSVALLLYNGVPLQTLIVSFPLAFFGAIMLTEPATMPSKRNEQLVFAWVVGLLFGAQLTIISGLSTSPHIALLIGNIIALLLAQRVATKMTLLGKKQLSPTTYEFIFQPERRLSFEAGQYIELTVPGVKFDSRGNRRTFTIASSPREESIHIGVKFFEKSSNYKKQLQKLEKGSTVHGAHVAGNFVLPVDTTTPIILVAGGVGITPFIAFLEDVYANGIYPPLQLHHFIADENEKIYIDTIQRAQENGVGVTYHVGSDARLTPEYIAQNSAASWYISGPPGMVRAYKKQLKHADVSSVKVDYFSGY